MNVVTRDTSNYEQSTKLQRRRSLFPSEATNSETDSDLGHISPLGSDSSLDNNDLNCSGLEDSVLSKQDNLGYYDILEIVENYNIKASTPGNQKAKETMSPHLDLSPHISDSRSTETYINETPSKMSSSYKLKTPHDTSSTNHKLPKLARKSLSESSEVPFNKRKLSPNQSPEQSKQFKLDPRISKVRTTLFPEIDLSLPAKQFYSNTENIMDKLINRKESITKTVTFPTTTRKTRLRQKVNQINKHVGHKVRKPKQKNTNKNTSTKIIAPHTKESAAITRYILDLKELRNKSEVVNVMENKENSTPIESKPNSKQIVPAIVPQKTHSEPERRKRPLSPDAQPEGNKKFFKSSRSKDIFKTNNNVITLDNIREKNKPEINLDSTDYMSDDNDLPNTNIDNIISVLEDDPIHSEVTNKIVLQAHGSVAASDSSILLHQQPAGPGSLILSPISQMCDETSGLAIRSPKHAKNLNYILGGMPNATQNSNEKLYPIFYGTNQVVPHKKEKRIASGDVEKKIRKVSANQMLLDAGQKRFGVTQCHECNIIYHMGDPSDEAMHLHYHNAGHILQFQGWKNERVVADFQANGRIIQMVPGDSKIWWKKSNDLMDLINQELGCYNIEFCLPNCQMFLYIKNKMIIGCAVALAKSEGHQLLSTDDNEADLCSERKYPIKCGIPRIWVAANHRRRGIATALMDCIKTKFIFDYALRKSEIAFSPPTELGKRFAEKYFGTPNFYIYSI